MRVRICMCVCVYIVCASECVLDEFSLASLLIFRNLNYHTILMRISEENPVPVREVKRSIKGIRCFVAQRHVHTI